MGLKTEKIEFKKTFKKKIKIRKALHRAANLFLIATKNTPEARRAILHELPGVYSMELFCEGESIRLIKEADEFRIMENSEKSELLTRICFLDKGVLMDFENGEISLGKAIAEGRLSFVGSVKYVAVLARVLHTKDKNTLREDVYSDLYEEQKGE